MPTTGTTVVTISHPLNELPLKSGAGFRGQNLAQISNMLAAAVAGSKKVTVDVQQNGGSGVKAFGVVTAASPAAADTVSVNGVATTAAQLSARGTVTIGGAVAVDDYVTIGGVILTAKTKCARATVTFASLANNDTVTVNGTVFTAKTSGAAGATEFNLGANDTAAAAAFVVAVNAHPTVGLIIEASSAAAVVKLKSLAEGTDGNAYTITSSNGTRAAVTVAVAGLMVGGAANVYNEWDKGDTVTQSARHLLASVNATRAAVLGNLSLVTAKAAAGVVSFRYVTEGTAGNAFTLAKSGTNISVSAATLASGAAPSGNQWDYGDTDAQAAASLADSLNRSVTAGIANVVTAAASGAAVTITATKYGVIGNWVALVSSNGTRLAVTGTSGGKLASGAEPAAVAL